MMAGASCSEPMPAVPGQLPIRLENRNVLENIPLASSLGRERDGPGPKDKDDGNGEVHPQGTT